MLNAAWPPHIFNLPCPQAPAADGDLEEDEEEEGALDATSPVADNLWLTCSELAISGRPRSMPIVQLPGQRQLVVPESVCKDADMRTQERLRPSSVQIAAQKGRQVWTALLQSAMKDMPWTSSSALLIINFTPYVEDVALAVADMRNETTICGLNSERIFYLSTHVDQQIYEYGLARVENVLVDAWMEKRLVVPGVEFVSQPPELSQEELERIPGGLAASGQLDKLKLTVTERGGLSQPLAIY